MKDIEALRTNFKNAMLSLNDARKYMERAGENKDTDMIWAHIRETDICRHMIGVSEDIIRSMLNDLEYMG